MAAVMLAGAPLCNEAFAGDKTTVQITDTKLADGVKFVIGSNNGVLQANDEFRTVTAATIDNVEYVTIGSNVTIATPSGTSTLEEETTKAINGAAVFEVRNYKDGVFELWVKGKQFVVDASTGNAPSFSATSTTNKIVKQFVAKNGAATTKVDFKDIYTYELGAVGKKVAFGTTNKNFGLSVNESMTAADLEEYNGSSTTFNFGPDAVEGNVFEGVIPVTVKATSFTGSFSAVAGTFFVKGADKDIKALKKALAATTVVAADVEAAMKKVSVATVLNETYGINTGVPGEGYKLAMISGADFYKKEKPANPANSAFAVNEGDQLNEKDMINLTVIPEVGTPTTSPVSVYIAAVKASASDTKTYVTTVAATGAKFDKVTKPMMGDNTYFAASEFLSANMSVYNVYFTSGDQSVKDGITTEYHKYLAVTADKNTSAASAFEAIALATDDIQLDSPLAQWVATNFDGKYTLTLTNRQTARHLVLKLKATDDAGIYQIVGAPAAGSFATRIANIDDLTTTSTINEKDLAGKKIKLVKTTASKYDGFLNLSKDEMANGVVLAFTGKTATLGETTFYTTPDKATAPTKLKATQDADDAVVLNISKAKAEIESELTYATLNDKNEVVTEKIDTLVMPAYNLSYSYKTATGAAAKAIVTSEAFNLNAASGATAVDFYFQKAMDGHYVVGNVTTAPTFTNTVTGVNVANGAITTNYTNWFNNDETKFAHVDVIVLDKDERTSLAAVSRHATFVNNRGAVSLEVNKNGILEGILSAEPATFWLDTLTNGDEVSFYISKGIKAAAEETKADEAAEVRNFMYYANDSLNIFNEGSALATQNKKYMLEGTSDVKAIFRPATLAAHDSLVTVVDGKEKSLVKDALKAFQYGIVLADEEVADEYVIYSKANPSKYLYSHNGKLGFGTKAEALVVTLGEGDATANEAIAAENVAVIAGEGVVTVKGAAGKQVVVSNILGQVIANKVATSDEETIAVAAGVAVVVVDGEATKVVVK